MEGSSKCTKCDDSRVINTNPNFVKKVYAVIKHKVKQVRSELEKIIENRLNEKQSEYKCEFLRDRINKERVNNKESFAFEC